jgi:hypothetical protein
MSLLHGLLMGMALLILVYLGVRNSAGVAAIFNAGGAQVNNGLRALQARP